MGVMSSRKKQGSLPPQLSERRVWNNHIGAVLADRTLWQLVALLSVLATTASVGGFATLALRSSFVPYIVEVDVTGRPQAVKPAVLAGAELPEQLLEKVLAGQVEAFVTDARRVTVDRELQGVQLRAAFAATAAGSPAATKLKQRFAGERNPFKRAAHETVSVRVRSVLHQAGGAWQVDWDETRYDRSGGGQLGHSVHYRGVITVKMQPPLRGVNEEEFRKNALGIYVVDFEWAATR